MEYKDGDLLLCIGFNRTNMSRCRINTIYKFKDYYHFLIKTGHWLILHGQISVYESKYFIKVNDVSNIDQLQQLIRLTNI